MDIVLSAEIILFSPDGSSLDNANEVISSNNIDRYIPSHESIKMVSNYFESLEFKVDCGDVTLSITGSKDLFEKTFATSIKLDQHNQTKNSVIKYSRNLLIPGDISNLVSKIIFSEPPEFFNNAQ